MKQALKSLTFIGFFAFVEAFPGDDNVQTLKKLFQDAEMLQGKTLDADIVNKLVAQMQFMYADKIDCETSNDSPIGFKLEGVPLAECGAASIQMTSGIKMLDWTQEFAIVGESNGKEVLVWNPRDVELVSGNRMQQQTAWKFKFNEEGQIVKYSQEFDTTALVADVASTNVQMISKLFDNAKQLLQSQELSPELIKYLSTELASSYTPKIDCAMSPSSGAGFDLKSVPLQDCLAKMQEFFGAFKQIDWNVEAVAATPDSGGKTVLLWQKNDLELAGHPVTMNNAWKFEINNAGLITAFTEELDTSVILDAEARIASLTAQLAGPDTMLGIFLLGCCAGAALATLVVRRYRIGFREGYDLLLS